jgi:signal transduction histidine kinase
MSDGKQSGMSSSGDLGFPAMGEKPIQALVPETSARNLSVCLLFALVSGLEIAAVVAGASMVVIPLVMTIQEIATTPSNAPALLVVAGLLVALLTAFMLCASHVMVRFDWYRLRWLFHAPRGGWPRFRVNHIDSPSAALVKPFVYLAVTMLAGAVLLAVSAAVVLISITCIASPFVVVGMGEYVDIGPARIETPLQAAFCAALGVVGFAALIGGAWPLARIQSLLVLSLIADPKDDFRNRLAEAQAAGARIIDAFDDERRRIERDLHDGIQPALLSLTMSLGLMRMRQMTANELDASLAAAQTSAKDLLEQTRKLIRGTFPDALLEGGLGPALSDLADGFAVPVTLIGDDQVSLPSHLETTLYFCVAELVTNAAKHASPRNVTVTVRSNRRKVWVEVLDDGKGGADVAGRGLTGVADRLRLVGGRVELDSPSGGPTIATVMVPRKDYYG